MHPPLGVMPTVLILLATPHAMQSAAVVGTGREQELAGRQLAPCPGMLGVLAVERVSAREGVGWARKARARGPGPAATHP